MSRPGFSFYAYTLYIYAWVICHDASQGNVKIICTYSWIITDKIFFDLITFPVEVVSLVYAFNSIPAVNVDESSSFLM